VRRGLGRGRLLIGVGAVLALVSMPLPWYTVGGHIEGLPAQSGNGLEGAGILVFLAAVALLAVLALPYASRNGRSSFDRLAVHALLVAVGLVGLTLRGAEAFGFDGLGLPDRSAGFWLAAAGLVIAAWGTSLLVGERASG
jgi:hypothetical protein